MYGSALPSRPQTISGLHPYSKASLRWGKAVTSHPAAEPQLSGQMIDSSSAKAFTEMVNKLKDKDMKKSRDAQDVLAAFPADVQDLAQEARRLLLKLLPDSEETVDPTAAVLSYGYGSGYRGMICTVLLSKSGVKIGFVGGAALPDPNRLLEGRGKKHKFVQLHTAADLSRPGLKQLIEAAYTAWQQRNS